MLRKPWQIPRAIPDQPCYMQPLSTSLVGGLLPFGAVFTELFFIMSSIWNHEPLGRSRSLEAESQGELEVFHSFSLFFMVFHGFFHDFSTHLARIDRFYYLFGFLSLVLVIVLITCAEISIALTYFQLTSEVDSSRFEAFRAASGPFRVLRRCIAAFEGAFRMVNPRSRGLQMVVDLLLSQ